MKLFGVQLVRPSFALVTRASGIAVAVWVAIVYGSRQLGMSIEPVMVLTSLLIGAFVFASGVDVFKDFRHLVVGLGSYVVLNLAVETLVLPLI